MLNLEYKLRGLRAYLNAPLISVGQESIKSVDVTNIAPHSALASFTERKLRREKRIETELPSLDM